MCRIKQDELNAVLQTMTEMGAGLKNDTHGHHGQETSTAMSGCIPSDLEGAMYCPHGLIAKLLQARVDTLDKEVG